VLRCSRQRRRCHVAHEMSCVSADTSLSSHDVDFYRICLLFCLHPPPLPTAHAHPDLRAEGAGGHAGRHRSQPAIILIYVSFHLCLSSVLHFS
jgi:hypothetical protein